jgi:hypothetical protein
VESLNSFSDITLTITVIVVGRFELDLALLFSIQATVCDDVSGSNALKK